MTLGLGHLKFRHKLLLPAAAAVAAMLLTAGFTLWSSRRSDALLRGVEQREAPALELALDLEGLLGQLQRRLQDAVEAEDEALLEEADRLHDELVARLGDGAHLLAAGRGEALRADVAAYHGLARSVCARLVAGVQPQAVIGELERVDQLAERARQVGEISETVDELAERSHVLSINASLEAVRAGEAGKGFAVVAAEVRTLAQQSRESAGKIAVIVRDILAAIRDTAALSGEGHRRMEESMEQVQASGESLREIGGIVRETSAAALQIAAAVQQQGTGVRQISQAMADIDGGMEITVQRIHAMDDAAVRLAATSARISAVMSGFRL